MSEAVELVLDELDVDRLEKMLKDLEARKKETDTNEA